MHNCNKTNVHYFIYSVLSAQNLVCNFHSVVNFFIFFRPAPLFFLLWVKLREIYTLQSLMIITSLIIDTPPMFQASSFFLSFFLSFFKFKALILEVQDRGNERKVNSFLVKSQQRNNVTCEGDRETVIFNLFNFANV